MNAGGTNTIGPFLRRLGGGRKEMKGGECTVLLPTILERRHELVGKTLTVAEAPGQSNSRTDDIFKDIWWDDKGTLLVRGWYNGSYKFGTINELSISVNNAKDQSSTVELANLSGTMKMVFVI